MFAEPSDPGLLIVFEGSDGSGKTTQRKLLRAWLQSMDQDVVVTKWNSSLLFSPVIKARKAARSLDPITYATLHAADFRQRYETVILPSLQQGKVVLGDRYVFTGIARDAARGLNPKWSANLYGRVRRPDLVFYFDASVRTFANRIRLSREMKFYEAGQDVTGLLDPNESFLQFGVRVVDEYKKLDRQFGFVIVDAEMSIYAQHRFVRETYMKRLTTVPAGRRLEAELNANFAAS
jgi:dTMP kinase